MTANEFRKIIADINKREKLLEKERVRAERQYISSFPFQVGSYAAVPHIRGLAYICKIEVCKHDPNFIDLTYLRVGCREKMRSRCYLPEIIKCNKQ